MTRFKSGRNLATFNVIFAELPLFRDNLETWISRGRIQIWVWEKWERKQKVLRFVMPENVQVLVDCPSRY